MNAHGGGETHDHDHQHEDGKAHNHANHHHGPASYGRAFAIGISANLAFVLLEVFYGIAVNSLALVADAGHNLGDVIGLIAAWAASWLAGKRATERRTYGLGRTTIMASLLNAIILLVGTGAITWEAVLRLTNPRPIQEGTVMWVAALGIAVNAGTALLFMAGRKGDINVRGAFMHLASDAAVAAGVVAAALLISLTGWLWLDPAVSLAIGLVIVIGTWGLFKESLNMTLDGVPAHIELGAVRAYLKAIPGVVAIHDLHVWPLSTTSVALTAHLVDPGAKVDDARLSRLSAGLKEEFGIDHATLQVETGDNAPCGLSDIHGMH